MKDYNMFGWRAIILAIMTLLFGVEILHAQADGQHHVLKDSTEQSTLEKDHLLDQVVVTSAPPRTKMKENSIETRIVGSILEHAGSAEDVLAKTPGMMRQGDDLKVIGRGTPIYYVNGRRVQNTEELKQIHSEQIKSIEVVNNPGSEYDATVSAVVKIRTIKQQGEGLSYELKSEATHRTAGGDTDPGTSVNLNYRYKNWDFFGCGSAWTSHWYALDQIGGGTYTKALTFEQDGSIDTKWKSWGYYANLGTNWQINDKHSLGAMIQLNGVPYGRGYKVTDENVYRDGAFEDHIVAIDQTRQNAGDRRQLNTYYSGQVGKLSIDWNFDWMHVNIDEDGEIDEQSLIAPRKLSTHTLRKSDVYATKLTFGYTLGKGLLKFGTEDSYVKSQNNYSVVPSFLPESMSSVKETNMAVFAEYSLASAWGQWVCGLRYEHVELNYENLLNDADNLQKRHDNIFPSLSWSQKFGPWSLAANYSVKTRRPGFNQLRESIQYHSRYVLDTGNPILENTINQVASITGNYKWLVLGMEYVHASKKILAWALPHNDPGTILLQSQNLVRPVQSYSAYAIASPTIGCWSPNYTAGVTQQFLTLDLVDDSEPTGIRRTSFNRPMFLFYANNAFRFNSRHGSPWQLELNLNYRSGMNSDNDELSKSIWSLEAAVQKSYLDNRLSFRLSADDLLRRMVEYDKTDYGNYIVLDKADRKGQSIKFTVTYRFNATRSKYKGSGAGNDVKNRL